MRVLNYVFVILLLINATASAKIQQHVSVGHDGVNYTLGYGLTHEEMTPVGFLGYQLDTLEGTVGYRAGTQEITSWVTYYREMYAGNVRYKLGGILGNQPLLGDFWTDGPLTVNGGLFGEFVQSPVGIAGSIGIDQNKEIAHLIEPFVTFRAGGRWRLAAGAGSVPGYVLLNYNHNSVLELETRYQAGEISLVSELTVPDSSWSLKLGWHQAGHLKGAIQYRF